jgi:hypothetical protein
MQLGRPPSECLPFTLLPPLHTADSPRARRAAACGQAAGGPFARPYPPNAALGKAGKGRTSGEGGKRFSQLTVSLAGLPPEARPWHRCGWSRWRSRPRGHPAPPANPSRRQAGRLPRFGCAGDWPRSAALAPARALPIRLREGWRSGWIAAIIACRPNCSRSARSAICAASIRQPVARAALRDFRDRAQHLGLGGIANGVCVAPGASGSHAALG